MESVVLGRTYKDKVHGVTGVAVMRCDHLEGYTRVCLQWLHEGRLADEWFDQRRLVPVTVGGADA